jgi:GT2 family glycosyltransferase
MKKKCLVSIVILSWNDKNDLQNCVESITQDKSNDDFQLIIVDNESNQEVKDYLVRFQTDFQGDLEVVWNNQNLGYAKGNNIAKAYIKGKYVLFLNQDIVVKKGAIEKLVRFLEDDKRNIYGAVAPQLLYPDGKVQESVRYLPTPASMWKNYRQLKWDDSKSFDHTKSQDCEQPMASAIMIRTDLFQKIGGFDENEAYWLFFNDVDLSKKIAEQGKKTYFLAEAQMFHYHGASTKKLFRPKKTYLWHRGMFRYFNKWYTKNQFLPKTVLRVLVGISFMAFLFKDLRR